MKFNTIIYEKGEGVGIIKLNRPEKLNALSSESLREIDILIDDMKRDDEVKVVTITGSEKFLAVGADISELAGFITLADVHINEPIPLYVFNKIEKLEKPLISAISGMRSVEDVSFAWLAISESPQKMMFLVNRI